MYPALGKYADRQTDEQMGISNTAALGYLGALILLYFEGARLAPRGQVHLLLVVFATVVFTRLQLI